MSAETGKMVHFTDVECRDRIGIQGSVAAVGIGLHLERIEDHRLVATLGLALKDRGGGRGRRPLDVGSEAREMLKAPVFSSWTLDEPRAIAKGWAQSLH